MVDTTLVKRVIVTPTIYPHLVESLHFGHSEHWEEITLRQHHSLTIAMLCFSQIPLVCASSE